MATQDCIVTDHSGPTAGSQPAPAPSVTESVRDDCDLIELRLRWVRAALLVGSHESDSDLAILCDFCQSVLLEACAAAERVSQALMRAPGDVEVPNG